MNKFQWNWDCRLRISIVEASFTLHIRLARQFPRYYASMRREKMVSRT